MVSHNPISIFLECETLPGSVSEGARRVRVCKRSTKPRSGAESEAGNRFYGSELARILLLRPFGRV